jgi:hypothetical protein
MSAPHKPHYVKGSGVIPKSLRGGKNKSRRRPRDSLDFSPQRAAFNTSPPDYYLGPRDNPLTLIDARPCALIYINVATAKAAA